MIVSILKFFFCFVVVGSCRIAYFAKPSPAGGDAHKYENARLALGTSTVEQRKRQRAKRVACQATRAMSHCATKTKKNNKNVQCAFIIFIAWIFYFRAAIKILFSALHHISTINSPQSAPCDLWNSVVFCAIKLTLKTWIIVGTNVPMSVLFKITYFSFKSNSMTIWLSHNCIFRDFWGHDFSWTHIEGPIKNKHVCVGKKNNFFCHLVFSKKGSKSK